jgi:hypothetical protein
MLGIPRSSQFDIAQLRTAIDAIAAGKSVREVCSTMDLDPIHFRAAVRAAGLLDELHKANGERAAARLDDIEHTITTLTIDDPETFKLELKRQEQLAALAKWRAERENPRYHPRSIDLGINIDATQALNVLARILGLDHPPTIIDADTAPHAAAQSHLPPSQPEHPASRTRTSHQQNDATWDDRTHDDTAS